jgi:hypothetical protein
MNPSDDPLIEALRSDLPSPEREAKLRRQLLAAGLAVAPGVVATTAGAATAGAGTSGASMVLAKLGALSWGAKLGLAAAVALPVASLPTLLGDQPKAPNVATPVALKPAATAEQREAPNAPNVPAHDTVASAPPQAPPLAPAQPDDRAVMDVRAGERHSAPSALAQAGTTATPIAAPAAMAQTVPSRAAFASEASALEPAPAPVSTTAASTLPEETRLLDRAFRELQSGAYVHAAALLDEHAQRFPNGLLRLERERARTKLAEAKRLDRQGD